MDPLKNIVDCHFHLWSSDRERFPFIPNPRYAPDYVEAVPNPRGFGWKPDTDINLRHVM